MAKILVVSNVLVPPFLSGTQQFIYNYCVTLKEIGHEVFFLYSGFASEKESERANQFWDGRFFHYKYSFFLRAANLIKRKVVYAIKGNNYSIGYYYPVFGLNSFVEKIHKKYGFDAVIVNYPFMTPLLLKTSIPNKILSTIDKFTDKRETIHAEYYSLSSQQEKEALSRADQILSIQEEETEYFKTLLPEKPIYTVFTQFEYHKTLSPNTNYILFFSGNSDLNMNGITYFIDKVWPLVKKEVPEAKLVIGGGICKALRNVIKDADIELVGYVDDVDEFYHRGNIAINPVYQGTGLKIKTLEALAYGKIMVVHPHSVAGLYKKDTVPVFVGDTDEKYANYLIQAIKGKITPQEISERCRQYVTEMDNYIVEQYKQVKFI